MTGVNRMAAAIRRGAALLRLRADSIRPKADWGTPWRHADARRRIQSALRRF